MKYKRKKPHLKNYRKGIEWGSPKEYKKSREETKKEVIIDAK